MKRGAFIYVPLLDIDDKIGFVTPNEKYGLVAYKARVTLDAIMAAKYDSELFNIKEDVPVHLMKNITYAYAKRYSNGLF